MAENETERTISYQEMELIDEIEVDIIPEKIGLFLKHVKYFVSSKRFTTKVRRRYNDFVAFHELLLGRFPYRLIPKLPPKKVVGVFDDKFLENRRRALCRWLTLVARHPVISKDTLCCSFMTLDVPDVQNQLRDMFKTIPDEFTTSDLAARAQELVPPDNSSEYAASRAQLRLIHVGVQKLKEISLRITERSLSYASDMEDFGNALTAMAADTVSPSDWGTGGNNKWTDLRKGFGEISKEFTLLSITAKDTAKKEEDEVNERLYYVLDMLNAYSELCDRIEIGVTSEHQNALHKMLTLKKSQIKGVFSGSDVEYVTALASRMLEQESVLQSVELRTAFSLYCVRMETKMIHNYLESLARALNSLGSVQLNSHKEMAVIWNRIYPIMEAWNTQQQV